MQLILWRHAQAQEGDNDLARPLTAKGHKQARKMARFLQQKLSGGYHVWVSEAERSRQTAAYLQHPAKVQAALNVLKNKGWYENNEMGHARHIVCHVAASAWLLARRTQRRCRIATVSFDDLRRAAKIY